MESKELMYGDWYSALDGDNKRDYYQFDFNDEFWSDAEPEPIPLTEDILKVNGFNIRRDAYYLSCGFLGNDWERSGVEVKFYDSAVIDIECNYFKHTNRIHLVADYVHELQHALRLCGLNDIADNFKLN